MQDIGSPSGSGLDFINGYSFLERFYSVFDTPTRVLVSLPLLSLPRRQTDNLRAEKLDLDTVYMIVLVVFSERME